MQTKPLRLKAQSVLEYILIIAVVAGMLFFAGVYYQRSLQGKYRQTGNFLGGGQQY